MGATSSGSHKLKCAHTYNLSAPRRMRNTLPPYLAQCAAPGARDDANEALKWASQSTHTVHWSEDVIQADHFSGRYRTRFCISPGGSNTIANDHLAMHRRRPRELCVVV